MTPVDPERDREEIRMTEPTPAEKERRRRERQRQLDEALEASFPASDPVSIVTSQEEEDWDDEPSSEPLPPSK
jgi:hypothetical protein